MVTTSFIFGLVHHKYYNECYLELELWNIQKIYENSLESFNFTYMEFLLEESMEHERYYPIRDEALSVEG